MPSTASIQFKPDISDPTLLQGEEAEEKLQLLVSEAETYSDGLIKANEGIDAKINVLFSFITALILFLIKAAIDEYVTQKGSVLFWFYAGFLFYGFICNLFILKSLITEETAITGRAPEKTLTTKNLTRDKAMILYHQLLSLQYTIEHNEQLNHGKAKRLKMCTGFLVAFPFIVGVIFTTLHLLKIIG
jgi:hypothetical protein